MSLECLYFRGLDHLRNSQRQNSGKHRSNIFPPPPSPYRSNRTTYLSVFCIYLCQEHDSFAIWPDDMVHLRTYSLPCQLWSAEAGLKGRRHSWLWLQQKAEKKAPATTERSLTTSISVLEWPILQTMQLFFMRSKCSRVTTFLFPESKDGWMREEMLGNKGIDWFSVRTRERGGLLYIKCLYMLWGKCKQLLQLNYLVLKSSGMESHQDKKAPSSGKHKLLFW